MRGDHPVCVAAEPTVSSIRATLPYLCQGCAGCLTLGLARPLAPVVVLETDDVVQLRRRHLEDPGVVDRLQAVHRAGREVERLPRDDHFLLEDPLPRLAELD